MGSGDPGGGLGGPTRGAQGPELGWFGDVFWDGSKPKKWPKMAGFPSKMVGPVPECRGRHDGADGGVPGARGAQKGPKMAIRGGLEKSDFWAPWWEPIIMGPRSPWGIGIDLGPHVKYAA